MAQVAVEAPPAAPAQPNRPRARLTATVVAIVAAGMGVAIAAARPRPPAPPDARAIGLAVYRDGTLYRVDGTTMRFDLPVPGRVSSIAAVPAGYLLDIYGIPGTAGRNEVWLRDPGGATHQLASDYDSSIRVSGDGRFLVLRTVNGVHVVEIATGHNRYARLFDTVLSVAGDWAIIGRDVNSTEPLVDTRAYVLWNVATGRQIPFAGDRAVEPVSVSPDGRVLEIVYPGGRVHTDRPQPVCVRLVAPAATVPSTGPGYCGEFGTLLMSGSPDNTWATFYHDEGVAGTVRLDDVAAGRWQPIGPAYFPWRWDSPRTYLIPGGLDDNNGFTRCTVQGTCTDLHLSTDDIFVFGYGV